MYRVLFLMFLLIAGLSNSCKSQNARSSEDENTSKMELILQDDYSGAVPEELLLIKNQKALQSFFAKINRTRKPGFPVPNIDFDTNMLLVWCEGETTAASLGLVLQKETQESYVISKLKPNYKSNTTAIISPFWVYKLPLGAKKIAVQ